MTKFNKELRRLLWIKANKRKRGPQFVEEVTAPPANQPRGLEVMGLKEGKKILTGKPDWGMVPMEAMEGAVRVFERGFEKYGSHRTWLPGIRFSLLFSAICRHLFDWFYYGRDKDEESGQHPLCHVISNCLMLLTFINEKRFDDRNKGGK